MGTETAYNLLADCAASGTSWIQESQRWFQQTAVGILVIDDNSQCLDANHAACELLHRRAPELVGRPVSGFFKRKDPSFSGHSQNPNKTPIIEGIFDMDLCDGSSRRIEVAAAQNFLPGVHLAFVREATTRESSRDLEHRSRLETIGKLAGGVAHDFNNTLTAILSYADLQLPRAREDAAMSRYVLGIQAAAQRAAETTRKLLKFCRRQEEVNLTAVDVNAVINETAELLRRLLGDDVQLVLNLTPRNPCVLADTGQVSQVIVNLVVNARDAMPRGGRIRLETAIRKSDAAANQEALVSLLVHDTGSGIPAEALPHIFDPFFTTKPQGKGTGLGLATVHGIVKQSHGEILVNSSPEHGTTFEVIFPAAPSEAVESEHRPRRDGVPFVTDGIQLEMRTQ